MGDTHQTSSFHLESGFETLKEEVDVQGYVIKVLKLVTVMEFVCVLVLKVL